MAPVVEAEEGEIAVSLATVFALNAVALFLFPVLGRAPALTERQFGFWAALAIHDTSSVEFGAVTRALRTHPIGWKSNWARRETVSERPMSAPAERSFVCEKSKMEVPLADPRCQEPKSYCKTRPACPIHALQRSRQRGERAPA